MNAAVHVRVVVLIERTDAIEDRSWLLRRGRVIQVNERFPVHALAKNREITANRLHIELQAWRRNHEPCGRGAHARPSGSSRAISSSTRARSGASVIWLNTSPTKARMRMCLACDAFNPRARR